MEEVLEAQHRSLDATDAFASAWSDALAEGMFEAASLMIDVDHFDCLISIIRTPTPISHQRKIRTSKEYHGEAEARVVGEHLDGHSNRRTL
jgi:hypothetical protein